MEPDPVPPATPFTAEVVRAVTAHMNGDHPRETLLICRALGGLPRAESARMVGLDAEGGDYRAVVDGAEVAVRIPWSQPLRERAQVRAEVVRMYREACGLLGVSPGAGPGRH
ncbi:DUF2470 domain-containing protein [Streptomonospora nanhaiensis]|uniref:Putative heme iron utilization protein n=1 Tax=Streptomonospora nanhaiensis TaxID=1323731 RepID=A0A853BHB9_9ACTN|nr:DUF2470 domain-containing protein [Streptomonospora nanhaiensis]MBV2362472.1 DUF2470 domain-containing protein [Streptomonospora nanhaiensis]MBX9389067.1 DUF2470 domain-containing protein [Streptomonospora nanhaiensis]NYI94868.1 putative heme iron utilization protein [Streptomonospora nanhaiensis]